MDDTAENQSTGNTPLFKLEHSHSKDPVPCQFIENSINGLMAAIYQDIWYGALGVTIFKKWSHTQKLKNF